MPESIIREALNDIPRQEKLSLQDVRDKKEVLDNKKVLMLLSDIASRPFIPFSSRVGSGLSNSKNDGFRVMKAATDEDYIRKVYVKSTKGRGQPALYLEITKKGLEFLRENGKWKNGNYFKGKMSFAGSLLIHTLIQPYYKELGYETYIEGFLKGADCDLGVMGDNKTLDIAVELSITTDARHEAENARRNFMAGWEKTIIVIAHFEDKKGALHHSDQNSEKKRISFVEYFSKALSMEENRMIEIKTIKDYRSEK